MIKKTAHFTCFDELPLFVEARNPCCALIKNQNLILFFEISRSFVISAEISFHRFQNPCLEMSFEQINSDLSDKILSYF